MQNEESFQVYVRQVSRRATDFKKSMDETLLGFAALSSETRNDKAISLQRAAQTLGDLLPPENWPNWLEPIHTAVSSYVNSPTESTATSLLAEILKYYSAVRPHRVLPDSDDKSPYRFDAYYEEARAATKVPDLFDAHVQAISAIIESREIESVTALNALIQLIATLKANRDASYAAIKQSVFLARFIHNSVLVALKKIPVLGIFVEAAETTLKDAEAGVGEIERIMNVKLQSVASQSLPRLGQTSQIIEQQFRALPARSQEPQLTK